MLFFCCFHRPIEAAVMLLPMYDLLHYNSIFRDVFRSSLVPVADSPATIQANTPHLHALLCLSSYLLTHASSTSSPRALAYAHLALTTLLVVVEDEAIISALCQQPPPGCPEVRLCRQVCVPSCQFNVYNLPKFYKWLCGVLETSLPSSFAVSTPLNLCFNRLLCALVTA